MGSWGIWDRGILHTRFLLENLKEIYHFETLAVNVRIIIKWIITKSIGLCGLESSVSGYGPVAGSCKDS
jgi:tRNA nucleotidyltransferase (CCA-adding enzyme)